jgi:predicted AlkP superfamily phosphohydrolase/phosphomutase
VSRRLIILGLDGFEISLAESMMASGDMPHMARLAETAAVLDLDHGRAKATGLAWEHVATGRGGARARAAAGPP